jgi:shikimate 5-dehydrogenase
MVSSSTLLTLALIIGAGGTAETAIYVASLLKLIPIVYNRSEERLVKLKAKYPDIILCTDFNHLTLEKSETIKLTPNDLKLILSTVPGNNDMEFNDHLFDNDPIIFDVSYKEKNPPLIESVKFHSYINMQATRRKCKTIILGIEMLINQGFMQCLLFTGKIIFLD